jgi:hypothetical protein
MFGQMTSNPSRSARFGLGLDTRERAQLGRDGFVVRLRAFWGDDLDQVRSACERLVERVSARDPGTPKIPAGSYCFQPHPELCTIVKWEPGQPDVVQGVEPFAHFDEALRDWGLDPRFVDPMCDLLRAERIALFTEKLNVKRARVGGPIVLHQDYPYWVANSEDPGQIATAVLFLEDADRGNGCLEVLPGSHLDGVRCGSDQRGFGRFEMDPTSIPDDALVALEVPAGSVVFFGSTLVHRSAHNRSGGDRRTLLYSYQPEGRPASVESLGRLMGRTE